MTFAVEIAEKVTSVMGVLLGVYGVRFGAPLGSVMWTLRAESEAELADRSAKLIADPGYQEMIAKGIGLFAGPPTDSVSTVVSSTLTPTPKRIYAVTRAVMANGKLRQAMEFGVRVQGYLTTASGLSTAFLSSRYGEYGGVGWLLGADTMAEIDAANALEASDEKFQALLDEAGGLFVEGSGHNSLIEKLN